MTTTNTSSFSEEMAILLRFSKRHAPKARRQPASDTRRCHTCERLIRAQDNGYCPGCRAEGQDFAR